MKHYRIKPGTRVDLKALDPSDHSGFDGGEPQAEQKLAELRGRLEKLQELLYAEHRHRLLLVLERDSRIVAESSFGEITGRLWRSLRAESLKAIGKSASVP